MKKRRYYLVFVAAILVLVACIAFQGRNSPNISDGADVPPISTKEAEASDPPVPPVPLVTYIVSPSGDILVSCIDKGVQLLVDDMGPYSRFIDDLPSDLPDADTLPRYEASNALEDPSNRKAPLKLSTIRSNGEWDFFPCDIAYTEYDLTSQPENIEWLEFFKDRLTLEGYDGPIIIAGSLSFSTDETDVTIVTASNIIVNDADIDMGTRSLPEPSNLSPAIYTISAAFIRDQTPTELSFKYAEIPKDRECAAWLGTAYNYWDTAYARYMQFISAIQYDESSLPQIYPILCNHGGELNLRDFAFAPQYLVCDIDGDGEVEIIQDKYASSSLMRTCFVYQLTDTLSPRLTMVLN